MPHVHSLDRVVSQAMKPWAMTQPMVSMVATVLARHLTGHALDVAPYEKRPPAAATTSHGVAIIPLQGVIAPRMDAMSDLSGGTSFATAGAALDAAMGDPDVATIVLDIDSPGGSVAGCGEFASRVLAAREFKRIIACANFEMCSAAYWVGACASEVVAAPSALVGSLGVYSVHEDLSAALAEAGFKITYISAGKYKVDGNETEPLSASAHARLKAMVDKYHRDFVGAVALGRNTTSAAVLAGFGEGAVCTSDEALALGMIDRIETIDQTLARVLAPPVAQQPAIDLAALSARARVLNEITLLALS
jgi:signal peptide peptidase SppA